MIENYYNATIAEVFGIRVKNGGEGVGIEIEVEGRGLPAMVAGWDAVRDGSLRGESFEYVIKGPSSLSLAKERVNFLAVEFARHGAVVKDAHRGSVHVHVNVQTKTIEQVFSTLYLWMIVEPLWLRLCGPQRDGNLFCLPSYCSGDMAFYCDSLLSGLRNKSFFNIADRGKYASINTDCLKSFGSLELRTFPSTIDPKKIMTWTQWCHNLIEKGSAIPISDMHKVWKAAYRDPRAFFLKVFDTETLKDFTDGDLMEFLERGTQSAGDMLIIGEQHLRERA